MGYDLLINGVYGGYKPLTTLLLTSWSIQVYLKTTYLATVVAFKERVLLTVLTAVNCVLDAK